ncbi:MAG TPA: hypothetical protein VLQ93_00920 [Myxococcaceae bacterium]|nr:hypothetical protein [Myxococcaceae bacterium]
MADTNDQDGGPQAPTLRVELGHTGTLNLVAAPITTLSLDERPTPLTVRELSTELAIEGRSTGFSEQRVPASLAWLVHYSPTGSDEFTLPGELHLSGGRFQFKTKKGRLPRLEVLAHRLFGKGTVGYRLTPQYPHAPSATRPPGSIHFDNPLSVELAPGPVRSHKMGTPLGFKLHRGPLIDELLQAGHEVRLVIDEEDGGEGRLPRNYKDLHLEWTWDKRSQKETLFWYTGCSADSTCDAPRFDYPEASEAGVHEFSYRLFIAPPQGSPAWMKPVEALKAQPLVSVARPSLRSFSLALEPAILGLQPPRLLARGELEGIDQEIDVSVDLTLWRRADKGRGRFTKVHGPVTVPVKGGRFQTDLYTFHAAQGAGRQSSLVHHPLWLYEPLWAWLSTYEPPRPGAKPEPVLFATVRLHASHLAQVKLPALASLGFDPDVFDAFDEGTGVMSSPQKGGGICSAEALCGSDLVERLKLELMRFYEG